MRLLTFSALLTGVAALNPSCHPGGNFDLSIWNLQLPTGSTGSPTTIPGSQLNGCSGYSSSVFYTDGSTGELVMTVPGSPDSSGCVTTPNSLHCRTELREISPSSWSPTAGMNRMKVTLSVPTPDDSGHGTVIGQIHIDDSISTKPVCELFYNTAGLLSIGVERTRAGGDLIFTDLTTITPGQTFTYEIRYESGALSIAVNNGAFVALDQYELANPNSYFKVGNYNQGDDYSEVRLQSISVSHGSSAPATGSAHAVTTLSQGGIGPIETLYQLDNTVTPYPSPTGACSAAPTQYSDSTVNLALFYEEDCCHAVETAHIGTVNVCHNSNGPFSAIEQAVGSDLFDRGIHIVGYDSLDCTGSTTSLSLSNSKGCQTMSGDGYLSFMVKEPPTCAATGPGVQSDSTVTLELYSDFGCCDSFETIKMGTLRSCHDANEPFHSFTQAVGANKFGWNIHIHTFTEAGCAGDSDTFSLTNAATCNKHGIAWQSFQIQMDCSRPTLAIKNDNTVTLALYRDADCCVYDGQQMVLGSLGNCHNADNPFGSIMQAVGQDMFGRDIHIEIYTGTNCQGTKNTFSLTNAGDFCGATGAAESFRSFRIVGPPATLETGTEDTCDWKTPSNSNPNTVTIDLYNDFSCCDYNKETVVGVAGTCHDTPTPGVLSLGIAPGSSWQDGSYIELWMGNSCTGDDMRMFYLTADLVNYCALSGVGTINSFRLISPELSTLQQGVPDPTGVAQLPAPTADQIGGAGEPAVEHPDTCPSDWVAVGYSQGTGIPTIGQDSMPLQANFGAVFFNGCQTALGGDDTWCQGSWVPKGWGVDCDGSGQPTTVTGPSGQWGNCFQLYSNGCSKTIGFASVYNYAHWCCSPL